MRDDGDLPPEAYAVSLEGIDLDALRKERGETRALHRHEQIARVLRDLRDGRTTPRAARAALHDIDPDHYQ